MGERAWHDECSLPVENTLAPREGFKTDAKHPDVSIRGQDGDA